jgi:hypothetical protein
MLDDKNHLVVVNFIIHAFYGVLFVIGFAYSWDYKHTGMLNDLAGILMLGCLFPAPIITSILFIKKCIKRWPKELRDSKAGHEIFSCLIVGLIGWYLAAAVTILLGSFIRGYL